MELLAGGELINRGGVVGLAGAENRVGEIGHVLGQLCLGTAFEDNVLSTTVSGGPRAAQTAARPPRPNRAQKPAP